MTATYRQIQMEKSGITLLDIDKDLPLIQLFGYEQISMRLGKVNGKVRIMEFKGNGIKLTYMNEKPGAYLYMVEPA